MVNMRTHRASRVLLVDPASISRSLTASTLESAGHHVLAVDRAENVFRTLAVEPPDVIVVDVEDTGDLLEQLAATPRVDAVPIVAVGGSDLVRLARAGVLEHVRRPFGYAELNAAVDAVLAMDDIAFERERIRALADELALT